MKDFSDLKGVFFTLVGDTADDQSRNSKDKTSFPETRPMYSQPPQVGDFSLCTHDETFIAAFLRSVNVLQKLVSPHSHLPLAE